MDYKVGDKIRLRYNEDEIVSSKDRYFNKKIYKTGEFEIVYVGSNTILVSTNGIKLPTPNLILGEGLKAVGYNIELKYLNEYIYNFFVCPEMIVENKEKCNICYKIKI